MGDRRLALAQHNGRKGLLAGRAGVVDSCLDTTSIAR